MLPIFASVSVCLSPLHSPSLSFPCYPLPLLSLSLSLFLSLSLSVSYSPTSASFLTVQFLLFLSLCLSVCERESGRDRHKDTKRVRYRKSQREICRVYEYVWMESGVLTEGGSTCRLKLYGRPTA